MNKLKALIGEHQRAALIVLFLLIVFVGGSIVSATSVASRRAQEAAAQTEQQGTQEEGTSAVGSEDVELTDSQRAAIEGYDDDTRAFIDTLSASVWSANNGRCTLRFADDSYVETVDGEPTTHSYAVLRIDRSSDGYGGTIETIVFETDSGTHVVTYTDGKGSAENGEGGDAARADGAVISSLASASMFAMKDTPYERADAVENIAVRGLNSEVTQLLGGNADSLTTELSRWCAVNYPTAQEAVWNGSAYVDWEDAIVSTDFTLNGETTVTVTAIYHMDTGTFEFNG